ncbi:hypothetical protein QQ045_001445 [Rhodiola kirilowii]
MTYCSRCKVHGHTLSQCRKNKPPKSKDEVAMTINPVSTEKDSRKEVNEKSSNAHPTKEVSQEWQIVSKKKSAKRHNIHIPQALLNLNPEDVFINKQQKNVDAPGLEEEALKTTSKRKVVSPTDPIPPDEEINPNDVTFKTTREACVLEPVNDSRELALVIYDDQTHRQSKLSEHTNDIPDDVHKKDSNNGGLNEKMDKVLHTLFDEMHLVVKQATVSCSSSGFSMEALVAIVIKTGSDETSRFNREPITGPV